MSILYIVVNEELELEQIVLMNQCCRVVASMVKLLEGMKPGYLKFYKRWMIDGQKITFLRTSWEHFDHLWETYGKEIPDFKKDVWCMGEIDPDIDMSGEEEGTMTVLAFRPMVKEVPVPKEILALTELKM